MYSSRRSLSFLKFKKGTHAASAVRAASRPRREWVGGDRPSVGYVPADGLYTFGLLFSSRVERDDHSDQPALQFRTHVFGVDDGDARQFTPLSSRSCLPSGGEIESEWEGRSAGTVAYENRAQRSEDMPRKPGTRTGSKLRSAGERQTSQQVQRRRRRLIASSEAWTHGGPRSRPPTPRTGLSSARSAALCSAGEALLRKDLHPRSLYGDSTIALSRQSAERRAFEDRMQRARRPAREGGVRKCPLTAPRKYVSTARESATETRGNIVRASPHPSRVVGGETGGAPYLRMSSAHERIR